MLVVSLGSRLPCNGDTMKRAGSAAAEMRKAPSLVPALVMEKCCETIWCSATSPSNRMDWVEISRRGEGGRLQKRWEINS